VAGKDRGPDDRPEAGVVRRPEAVVLGEEALVPERNVVKLPPNRFAHELLVDEPYRLDRPWRGDDPDGVLPSGTRVVLLIECHGRCCVVDGSGLYVEVRRASLRKLPDA
jgi:hypothetical protein